MPIYLGQDVSITIQALDPQGNPGNPASVRFKVKSPAGVVTTYALGSDPEVTQVEAGAKYRCVFDASEPGKWHIRSETLDADDNVIGVDETSIIISQSSVI